MSCLKRSPQRRDDHIGVPPTRIHAARGAELRTQGASPLRVPPFAKLLLYQTLCWLVSMGRFHNRGDADLRRHGGTQHDRDLKRPRPIRPSSRPYRMALTFGPISDSRLGVRIWLATEFVNRLGQMRGPGESYSDVILRIAKESS